MVASERRRLASILIPLVGWFLIFQLNSSLNECSGSRELFGANVWANSVVPKGRDDTEASSAQMVVDDLLVQPGDSICLRNDWDSSPIVIESHKLIFFSQAKVGCTVWKQLFRRMMGEENWRAENVGRLIPWNPEVNGLTYLYHYNRTMASHMITSPEYTRAIFVRDPKERFLSAYLDKAVGNPQFIKSKCCPYKAKCVQFAKESLANFFELISTCDNEHWRPQGRRMEARYWQYINFVGHMESVAEDARELLIRIGAWEEFGKTGWGSNGNRSIFETESGGHGRTHATDAKKKLATQYTPDLEKRVEAFYASDYSNSVLNISLVRIFDE